MRTCSVPGPLHVAWIYPVGRKRLPPAAGSGRESKLMRRHVRRVCFGRVEAWSHGERPEAQPRAGVFVTHGLARVSSAPAPPRQLLRTPAALTAAWRSLCGKKKVTSRCISFLSYLPAIPARNTEVRSHLKRYYSVRICLILLILSYTPRVPFITSLLIYTGLRPLLYFLFFSLFFVCLVCSGMVRNNVNPDKGNDSWR